jgi:CHAT domain-containing protein
VPLLGAAREASLVSNILAKNNYIVNKYINSGFEEIVLGLFKTESKILHLAGYGLEDYNGFGPGLLLGEGKGLKVTDLENLGYVPEFVFINTCHLGIMSATSFEEEDSKIKNPITYAVNFAHSLVNLGIGAVVIAGWPVNNEASEVFIEELYNLILDRHQFGKAVQMARQKCYFAFPDFNTWGAFQCYGDPWFQLSETTNMDLGKLLKK